MSDRTMVPQQTQGSTPPRPEPDGNEPADPIPSDPPDQSDSKEQYPEDKDMPLPND